MSAYTTLEIVSYVLGDAPPALADEISGQETADPQLSAKVAMLRASVATVERHESLLNNGVLVGPAPSTRTTSRRPFRWRTAAAACLGFLALTGLSWGAWQILKPKPLLEDSFSRPWFDATRWHSERPILKAESGYLALINRGSFHPQQQFSYPLDLRFEWQWRDLAGYPHYSESFSVALRTTGKHALKPPFDIRDGVVVTFHTYAGIVTMVAPGLDQTLGACENGTLPLVAGEWYSIRITDDGDEVAVYIRGPEIHKDYWTTPVMKVRCKQVPNGPYFAIFNREVVAGVPHESHIRNLELWPYQPQPGQ